MPWRKKFLASCFLLGEADTSLRLSFGWLLGTFQFPYFPSFLSYANCKTQSGNIVQFLSKEEEVLKATRSCLTLSWELHGALSILSKRFGVLMVCIKIAVGILLVENIYQMYIQRMFFNICQSDFIIFTIIRPKINQILAEALKHSCNTNVM